MARPWKTNPTDCLGCGRTFRTRGGAIVHGRTCPQERARSARFLNTTNHKEYPVNNTELPDLLEDPKAVTAALEARVNLLVPSDTKKVAETTEGPNYSMWSHTWRRAGRYATLTENTHSGQVVGWQFQEGLEADPSSLSGTNAALTGLDDQAEAADFLATMEHALASWSA